VLSLTARVPLVCIGLAFPSPVCANSRATDHRLDFRFRLWNDARAPPDQIRAHADAPPRRSPDTEPPRMSLRRVVVGNVDGASAVLSDEPAPRSHDFAHMPGFSQTLVWRTAPNPSRSFDGADPTLAAPSLVPPASGTSLIVVTIPPDTIFADPGFDPAGAAAEALEHSPGIAETMEPDNPGMHTTPTVDYDIVLDGEVWLELSDGREVRLAAGDVVVQHGTRHAWRNRSDRPATIAAILIGADA
jgi:hypothetical protein